MNLTTNVLMFSGNTRHKKITLSKEGKIQVPDHVRIPYVDGDGIGPEIMNVSRKLVDEAVKQAYGDSRSIEWVPIVAGLKADPTGKDLLPKKTLDTIKSHHVFVKSPMDTPVGEGFKSLNVTLRKMFDMFACVRPYELFPGVVSPLRNPRNIDVTIFRENTEDVYTGIEFKAGSKEAKKLIAFLKKLMPDAEIRPDAGLGIKPISEFASRRLVDQAIQYAIKNNKPSVTIMHKGNIMKHTEGAFLKWSQALVAEKYADQAVSENDFWKQYNGDFSKLPKGKFVFQNRIADNMFQKLIQEPHRYHVIATMNLNGDYVSDAYAATVGGLGLAPGANIGDKFAMFESTGGTAPDIAGQNKANPSALFLTMEIMLKHLGWTEAGDKIRNGIASALTKNKMTGDLARDVPGVKALSTTDFTQAVLDEMKAASGETITIVA